MLPRGITADLALPQVCFNELLDLLKDVKFSNLADKIPENKSVFFLFLTQTSVG